MLITAVDTKFVLNQRSQLMETTSASFTYLISGFHQYRMAESLVPICCLLLLFIFLQVPGLDGNQFNDQLGHVPAMYAFGDSLIDCGNNNYLPKDKPVRLPYGIDFEGGKATGRATNGKTVADFMAEHLRLPLLPAYLSLSESERRNISTGINYASGGSGILPETGRNGDCLPLDNQAEFFRRTVKHDLPKLFKTKSKLKKHLSESLFFISTGINDITIIYGDADKNSTELHPNAVADIILKALSKRLRRLYHLGGRKFLVNNLPPSGCFPPVMMQLRTKSGCNEQILNRVTPYNFRLPGMLRELQSQLSGSAFFSSNLYDFLLGLRKDAKKYGITNIWSPCCPENFGEETRCKHTARVCKNRNTYLFFDPNHPSEIANRLYARGCFHGSVCCPVSGSVALMKASASWF